MKSGFGYLLRGMLLATLAVVALVAAGCGGGSGGGSTGSDAKPKQGGTLRVALGAEIHTLEPSQGIAQEIFIVYQMVDTLFVPGKNEEAEPWLVTKYESSPDLREWTLHLRKGVKFSDGKPMTAADVVFSLETVQESEIWGNLYEEISSIAAPDPQTVVIKTKTPAPALPDTLTLFASGIIPKDFGGVSEEEFAKHPIGTGPFELAAWNAGKSISFKPNPHYWRPDRPYLDELVFVPVAEDTARVSQLEGNELNVAWEPPWSQVQSVESTPGLTISRHDETLTTSLLLNDKLPLFKDKRAREAVNLAINREDITNASTSGQATPAGSWFPGFVRYAKDIPPPTQDIAKAKQLLAEAVKATAEKPSIELTYNAGETIFANASQIIQQNLEEAGFEVSLRPLEGGAYEELVFTGEYDAATIKVITLMYDPVEFAAFYPATSGLFTFSDTTKVNELVVAAAQETDPEKRQQLYYEIQELIAAEQYVLPMSDLPNVYAIDSELTGFEVPGTGYVRYDEVAFGE